MDNKTKQRLACQYSAITNTIMSSTIFEWESIGKQMMDDKQACIIEFVLFSILSTNL